MSDSSSQSATTPDTYASLLTEFERQFGHGGSIHIVRAPGRVNLIGEHTDYNDGFVCPMAIEPQVTVICRKRADRIVRLASTSFPNTIAEFVLDGPIEKGEPKWANYSKGVARYLQDAGVMLTGCDLLLTNTLAVGAGLSSSAAIEVGTAKSLLFLAAEDMDGQRLALLCQKAEHVYAGVPCGIMDQTIVACAQKDHALLLDCRDLSKTFIPLDGNSLRVVIINSMVKHELSGGEYAERRSQCEDAVAALREMHADLRSLRDADAALLQRGRGAMSDVVYRRARHVIGEIARTVAFGQAMMDSNFAHAGTLMNQSHASLRDDYEVSCEELDLLAATAADVQGVFGARMTGGGFGGCVVALCKPEAVDTLKRHATAAFESRYGKQLEFYVTRATAGASVVR
jgi:galactokinase